MGKFLLPFAATPGNLILLAMLSMIVVDKISLIHSFEFCNWHRESIIFLFEKLTTGKEHLKTDQ